MLPINPYETVLTPKNNIKNKFLYIFYVFKNLKKLIYLVKQYTLRFTIFLYFVLFSTSRKYPVEDGESKGALWGHIRVCMWVRVYVCVRRYQCSGKST